MFFSAAVSLALHVALITSNDTDSNPPTSQRDMQNHALHMFFTLGEDEPRDIELWRHLSLLDEADRNDCCTWMGVWCTQGSVTSLILAYPFTKHMVLFNMAAAPPTVQFVHFPEGYRSVWENVSPRFFPRDLRYLCLKKAQMYILDDLEVDNVFDLSLLPAKVEEIHLEVREPVRLYDVMLIRSMPPSLRILSLVSTWRVPVAVVDGAGISEGLELIELVSSGKLAKIQHVGGSKAVDKRIRAQLRVQWQMLSKYVAEREFLSQQMGLQYKLHEE